MAFTGKSILAERHFLRGEIANTVVALDAQAQSRLAIDMIDSLQSLGRRATAVNKGGFI